MSFFCKKTDEAPHTLPQCQYSQICCSLPEERRCLITQPFEDQAWEKQEENEWRHHHFYFRLHILEKKD